MEKIQKWILENLKICNSDSATAFYDLMERQCFVDIPGVHRPYDPKNLEDWMTKIKNLKFSDNITKDAIVLDIGCGDGYPSLVVAPYSKKVIGIDASLTRIQKSIENCKKMKITNTDFLLMKGEKLDFQDNYFDRIVASSAIEQTSDYLATLKETFRVLKRNGDLIISIEDFLKNFPIEIDKKIFTFNIERKKDQYLCTYKVLLKKELKELAYLFFITTKEDHAIDVFLKQLRNHKEGYLLDEVLETKILNILNNATIKSECLYYELIHFTTKMLHDSLFDIGFSKVSVELDKAFVLKNVILELHKNNLLEVFSPYFETICRSLYQINIDNILSPSLTVKAVK